METRAYVGEFGPRAQALAKAKIDAWSSTHDTKNLTIVAGRVYRPKDANAHQEPTIPPNDEGERRGDRLVGNRK